MKRLLGLLVMLGVLSLVSSGFAGVATIQTSVSLVDDSELALDAAVTEAVDTVMRGALAMGLPHVQLIRAAVVEHALVIEVRATDTATSGPGIPRSPHDSPRRPEVPPSRPAQRP